MPRVQVLFSRSNTIGAPIIRALTWSSWSHCALVTPERTVIEAVWPHGVTETDLEYRLAHSSLYRIIDVEVPNPAAAVAWARAQLGRPYDTAGVLGIGAHRDWQSPDSWWCSELVEAAIVAGGRTRFRTDVHRVTPQQVFEVI